MMVLVGKLFGTTRNINIFCTSQTKNIFLTHFYENQHKKIVYFSKYELFSNIFFVETNEALKDSVMMQICNAKPH